MLFFFQELPAALRRISDFLGKNLSEEAIQNIAEHCSFKSMKANTMSNFSLVPKMYMDSDKSPFFRKGEALCVHCAFHWISFTSEIFCVFVTALVCVHFCVRCCWRLEKPFQPRATGPVHICPFQRAGGAALGSKVSTV